MVRGTWFGGVIAAVVRVLERPDHATGLCIGAWLALVGAVAILFGAWLALRDERSSAVRRPPRRSRRPRSLQPNVQRWAVDPRTSRLRRCDRVIGAGALALLVIMFLFKWYGVSSTRRSAA